MALPYYEFEIMLEEIKQIHKEQEEENKRQEKEIYSKQYARIKICRYEKT